MAALEQVDCRTAFDQEQQLRGFRHGREVRQGLLGAVVEDEEILLLQAVNEVARLIRHGHADANEVDLDPDRGGGNVRCRGLLRSAARSGKEQRWKKKRRPRKPQNPIPSLTPPTRQISDPWSLFTIRPPR